MELQMIADMLGVRAIEVVPDMRHIARAQFETARRDLPNLTILLVPTV